MGMRGKPELYAADESSLKNQACALHQRYAYSFVQ